MPIKIPDDAFALIIGAMRCGTSSLYSYLQTHPAICPARKKEPEYFSEHQRHGVQTEDYFNLWSFDPAIHKYAMEASTGYTKYPYELNVPENIRNYGIRPKFIYIVRNPYDRIESHYNFMRYDKSGSLEPVDPQLVSISNYFLQLQQYTKYFSRDDILILDFDDLATAPSAVLKKAYHFLRLSPDYFPRDYRAHNVGRVDLKFLRKVKCSEPGELARTAIRSVARLGAKVIGRRNPSAKRMLTERERSLIRGQLQDDMANLYRGYGVDVRKWGFDT